MKLKPLWYNPEDIFHKSWFFWLLKPWIWAEETPEMKRRPKSSIMMEVGLTVSCELCATEGVLGLLWITSASFRNRNFMIRAVNTPRRLVSLHIWLYYLIWASYLKCSFPTEAGSNWNQNFLIRAATARSRIHRSIFYFFSSNTKCPFEQRYV